MAGLHPQENLIEDLVREFRTVHGGMRTEFMMAEELIALAQEIERLEAENKVLQGDWHHAFHRQQRRS